MKACPQLFGPIGVALTCLGISAVSVADAVERVGLVYSADRSDRAIVVYEPSAAGPKPLIMVVPGTGSSPEIMTGRVASPSLIP